jgi:hypothetical protein
MLEADGERVEAVPELLHRVERRGGLEQDGLRGQLEGLLAPRELLLVVAALIDKLKSLFEGSVDLFLGQAAEQLEEFL